MSDPCVCADTFVAYITALVIFICWSMAHDERKALRKRREARRVFEVEHGCTPEEYWRRKSGPKEGE